MTEARRPCRRCLIADLPEGAELMALIRERIDAIPPEERAPDALQEERLDSCRRCEALHRGTCARCGCYVEIRAARQRLDCPDVPSRWKLKI